MFYFSMYTNMTSSYWQGLKWIKIKNPRWLCSVLSHNSRVFTITEALIFVTYALTTISCRDIRYVQISIINCKIKFKIAIKETSLKAKRRCVPMVTFYSSVDTVKDLNDEFSIRHDRSRKHTLSRESISMVETLFSDFLC